mgnify:CR=1 FL=1
MSEQSLLITPEEQRALERFYFHEARLLDNRQFQQWLALVTEDIRYHMPSRVNAMVNNRERGSEDMISPAKELEDAASMGAPHREENYIHLMVRVERAFKINSWAEHPPARTRRLVGNIELMGRDGAACEVLSNFHLYWARPGNQTVMYSGRRRDTLRAEDDGFRIAAREVVLDYADIELPTLGLLF